jgi:hypothetical protein
VKMDLISLVSVHAAVFAAGPAGKGVVATQNPYAAAQDPVAMAHPGQARVRSVRDLGPVAGVADKAMTTAEAARVVAELAPGVAQYTGAGVGG